MNLSRLFVAATILLLVGCSASSTVKYAKVTAPDAKGLMKFKLQSSLIVVDHKRDDKGTPLPDQFSITSIPVEEPSGDVYAIAPSNSWGVKTNLNLATRENTLMVSSVGTEVEDNRVKYIQQAASVIAALIPLIALAPTSEPSFPAVIDVSRIHLTLGQDDGKEKTIQGKLNGLQDYTVKYGPVSPSAIAKNSYDFSGDQNVFVYSACRDAVITFDVSNGVAKQTHSATIRISDPNFVETIAFPQKGQVAMQSACGVTVTSQPVNTASALEILTALIDAGKTIRDAEKNKTNPNTKTN
jgi:hypothetical protein